MSIKQLFRVAGVDGCKAGWFAAIISVTKEGNRTDGQCVLELERALVANTFTEILPKMTDCEVICVDIPIGLSDGKRRECDLAARKVLGGQRASSVFPAPIRPCLSAKDYKTACEISSEHSGKRLSWQSFFLLDMIRQVDDLMTPALQRRVREIHPEVSFWVLNHEKPTRYKKTRLIGRNERMKLLAPIFSELERIVAEARKPEEVAPDDILDALVAAWTASQAVLGKTKTLPEDPEFDSKGLRMEILCPVPIIDSSR